MILSVSNKPDNEKGAQKGEAPLLKTAQNFHGNPRAVAKRVAVRRPRYV